MRRLDQMPLSRFPKITPQACDARRSPQQSAASPKSAAVAGPTDLVARALAILAEEKKAWQERRSPDRLSER
jgi:hypothetical protein